MTDVEVASLMGNLIGGWSRYNQQHHDVVHLGNGTLSRSAKESSR
jgi:hypothetical protein